MAKRTLPLPFRSEGRRLRGPVPADFEAFYRARLRYRSGSRVRSHVLNQQYQEWALQHGRGSLNMREIKRAMLNIGHRHLKSNGMVYGNVALAVDAPRTADNFPSLGPGPADGALSVAHKLDIIMGELMKIRAEVAQTTTSVPNVSHTGRE